MLPDIQEFHEEVWTNWRECNLNWGNLNLSESDFRKLPVEEKKWLNDQEWELIDQKQFYYPLFGMGNSESEIAIVGAAPGHNVGFPWRGRTQKANYRENINYKESWCCSQCNPVQEHYYKEFKKQKRKWEVERGVDDNGKSQYTMYDNLYDIIQVGRDEDFDIFDSVYYTNFMKDGEFLGNMSIEHKQIAENLKSDRWDNIARDSTSAHRLFEVASREFWLPFLCVELELLDPNVIVPLGSAASEAIQNLYNLTEWVNDDGTMRNITQISGEPVFTEDGKTIIPSVHLSGLRNISGKDEYKNEIGKKVYEYC